MTVLIQGTTAAEIASSIRAELDTGALGPGDPLPTARELAQRLGVNRNTVVSAYRQLALAGLLVSRRGAGTTVAPPATVSEEGYRPDTAVADVGSGNPNRSLLPDLSSVPIAAAPTVLYGESTMSPELGAWAEQWFATEITRSFQVTVMSGAVEAIERLLAASLAAGDPVALEDPCFLTSINTVRRAGYRAVPVPVDSEGMTADGLRTALDSGARVVICTPRAHNPTGANVTARRARSLREVLAEHPHVLVIEDDHFSMLASGEYHSIVPAGHANWALVRSLSKFLGPDLRVALVAADPGTHRRLSLHISAGANWVSHLLQRTAHALLTDPSQAARVARAREHYRERNARFMKALDGHGIDSAAADGLNVWVDTRADAHAVSAELVRRGWAARTGDEFAISSGTGDERLRVTVHDLDDNEAMRLAEALAVSIRVVLSQRVQRLR